MISEQSARAWYEFVEARLDETLRGQYKTTDSSVPPMGEYRKRMGEVKAEHESFLEAWHRDDQGAAENGWWGLKNIVNEWRTDPDFPEPISDGTLACPGAGAGHPCVKPIHAGWTPSEGHGGGHFWQAPKVTKLKMAGAHVNDHALLAGQPPPTTCQTTAPPLAGGGATDEHDAGPPPYRRAVRPRVRMALPGGVLDPGTELLAAQQAESPSPRYQALVRLVSVDTGGHEVVDVELVEDRELVRVEKPYGSGFSVAHPTAAHQVGEQQEGVVPGYAYLL
ncbi:hypothetical protein [Streptomyces sp. NPDC002426]